MADVGYHFANLWFAADKQNWPLAKYYLDETRSHLKWAVRIQPARKTRAGREVDLNGILEAVDNTMLAEIGKAIESKDTARFETEYRQTLVGCYACHTACEKPFLRLQVPSAPGAPIISFSTPLEAADASAQAGDAIRGKVLFQQNCALCHGVSQGPGNVVMTGQGPNLMGIAWPARRFGRQLQLFKSPWRIAAHLGLTPPWIVSWATRWLLFREPACWFPFPPPGIAVI